MCQRSIILPICLFLLVISSAHAKQRQQQQNSEIVARVEAVLNKIYALTTDEFIDVVKQDVGCIQIITASQLHKRMATEPNLLVINVLSERWYRDCHIKGSINIPLKELIYRIKEIELDRPVVVYCALDACNGGQKAYILLRALGYTNVVDYHEGVKDWFQHGYPVEGPCAESYLHEEYIHRAICLEADGF